MIRRERSWPAPASLSAPAAQDQLAKAGEYYLSWKTGDSAYPGFTAYKEPDVVEALRTMFHGKCAYCEGNVHKGDFDVEHYRPKGGVNDHDGPQYWWLAFTWTNLLPSSEACNRALRQHVVTPDMTEQEVKAMRLTRPVQLSGKATHFPIGAAARLAPHQDDHDAEYPHLIDPCRSDPAQYIAWRHASDFSIICAASWQGTPSPHGEATIRCMGLNRVDLVEERTKTLQILKTMKYELFALLQAVRPLGQEDMTRKVVETGTRMMLAHCDPEKAFSGMATDFMRSMQDELTEWLRVNHPKPDA